MLREWQNQCADAALNKYQSGSPHFLCLACPGAGKTVMAAEVAKRMRELDLVDIIICFAPSTAVVSSIKSTFSYVLKSNFCGGLDLLELLTLIIISCILVMNSGILYKDTDY